MEHVTTARKTGPSLHDCATITLYTPAEHEKRCPFSPIHGESITPEQNAAQLAWFLKEHIDAETVAILARKLVETN